MFYFYCKKLSETLTSSLKINQRRCLGCDKDCVFANLFNMAHNALAAELASWLSSCPLEQIWHTSGIRIIPRIEYKVLDLDLYTKCSTMAPEILTKFIKEYFSLMNKLAEKFSELEEMLINKFVKKM